MQSCVECGQPAAHQHHVIPKSLGGTFTVPLCERHHGLVHGRSMVGHRALTKAGMARKRARGEYTGGATPFGYQLESGRVLEDPTEQLIIGEIRALRASGLSVRAVAATLAERGRRTRAGAPVGPGLVQRILARAE